MMDGMTEGPLVSGIRLDTEEQLHTRVAWYYFVGNLTQQEIADRLGTSRVRVNRLIAACREKGLVQIAIHGRLGACEALGEALVERYGLTEARVVPTPGGEEGVREAIGVGAAEYLDARVRDGMTLGVNWGRTMRSVLRAIPSRPLSGISVVCLQGGLAHCSGINTFEIVSDLADRYAAEQHFFAAPIFAGSESDRDLILAQQAIRETYDKALASDMVVITVGEMTESLVVTYGLERPADRVSLIEAGAVCDVLGRFIDSRGEPVDHPLNRRVVSLTLAELRAIHPVVLAAGGRHRVEAVRAALACGVADILITDEATARALTG